MNPNHDKEGKFTTSGNIRDKLNNVGFYTPKRSNNYVTDEQGNYHYEFPSDVGMDFFESVGFKFTPELLKDFDTYHTIPEEAFEDFFGDEDDFEEMLNEYKGIRPKMSKEDYDSIRADEKNDEEWMNE